jgi:hypothetical protein
MISINCGLLLRLHWALGITWVSRGGIPALQASYETGRDDDGQDLHRPQNHQRERRGPNQLRPGNIEKAQIFLLNLKAGEAQVLLRSAPRERPFQRST